MNPNTELDTDRRQNTHEQRMKFLTRRLEWITINGTTFPDRRQPTNQIRSQRKVDKNATRE